MRARDKGEHAFTPLFEHCIAVSCVVFLGNLWISISGFARKLGGKVALQLLKEQRRANAATLDSAPYQRCVSRCDLWRALKCTRTANAASLRLCARRSAEVFAARSADYWRGYRTGTMVPLTCLLVFNSRSREWMYAWLLVILFCTATLGPSTVVVGRTGSLPPAVAGLYDGGESPAPATPRWSAAVMPAFAPLEGRKTPFDGMDEAGGAGAADPDPQYRAGHAAVVGSVRDGEAVEPTTAGGSGKGGQQQPASGFPVDYSCSQQDVQALQCTNASLLSPSWCRYQVRVCTSSPPLQWG